MFYFIGSAFSQVSEALEYIRYCKKIKARTNDAYLEGKKLKVEK